TPPFADELRVGELDEAPRGHQGDLRARIEHGAHPLEVTPVEALVVEVGHPRLEHGGAQRLDVATRQTGLVSVHQVDGRDLAAFEQRRAHPRPPSGSNVQTISMFDVIGMRSSTATSCTRKPRSRATAKSRASVAGSHET